MAYRGKPIGISNAFVAKMLTETRTETTYDAPVELPGLREVAMNPVFAEAELFADDIAEDSLKMMTGLDVTIEDSQLTNETRALLLGNTYDDKGGLLAKSTDQPPMFAFMFRITLSTRDGGDPKYAYVCLYKMRFADFAETVKTKEGTNVTFTTHAGIAGKAYPRMSDDAIKYSIRGDDPNFDKAQAEAWFTEVPEPGTKSANPSSDTGA